MRGTPFLVRQWALGIAPAIAGEANVKREDAQDCFTQVRATLRCKTLRPASELVLAN